MIEIIFGILLFLLFAMIYGHKVSMDNIIERLEYLEEKENQ